MVDDFVYHQLFTQVRHTFGLRTIYTITDNRQVPAWWKGHVGYITPELIQAAVPDYQGCLFYISGSDRMVNSFRSVLHQLQIRNTQIKTDFFSGLA